MSRSTASRARCWAILAATALLYTLDRTNGSFINASQYVKNLNWTKGIDPKTGKPVEYDPSKKLQQYAAVSNRKSGQVDVCPDLQGAVSFFPTSYNASK